LSLQVDDEQQPLIPKTNDADKADLVQGDEPQQNLGEILTTDFMKDLVGDLGMDIDAKGMDDIMGQIQGVKKEDEEKKDEEKDPKNAGKK